MILTVLYPPEAGETGRFAAEELAAGISKISPETEVSVMSAEGKTPDFAIQLSLAYTLSAGKDPFWDDGYALSIINGCGSICASNPRSLLLGTYRLLTEAGCVFLSPKDTFYPQKDWGAISVQLREEAFYRHRGICIEGSVSIENVLDLIDWAPKVGYNSYFTQFMEAYTFFERWYRHLQNPFVAPEPFSMDMARDYMRQISAALRLRGLLYHGVGHGWTCEPLGIPGLGWDAVSISLTEEQTSHLAQINGRRALWNHIPLNTNLCYGSEKTRALITDAIVDYAAAHPDIDVLYFWLADDSNNQCECPACQKMIPSDAYVKMLNALDEKLTRRNLKTKIAFLLYFDLLWPPVEERIQNPDRFLLMFAPITRTFTQPLSSGTYSQPIPRYERNRLHFSHDVGQNITFLKAWQQVFTGDSFDYDYHLISPLVYDMGLMVTSRILYQDVCALKSLGLNGIIHCQVQRVGIPHNFGGWMAGHMLWDPTRSYETEKQIYFSAAFGDHAAEIEKFFTDVGQLFPIEYLEQDTHGVWPPYAARSAEIRSFLMEHRRLYTLCAAEKTRRMLRFYWQLLYRLNQYLTAQASGDIQGAASAFRHLQTFLWRKEPETQSGFDTYIFWEYYRRRRVAASQTNG